MEALAAAQAKGLIRGRPKGIGKSRLDEKVGNCCSVKEQFNAAVCLQAIWSDTSRFASLAEAS